MLMSSIRSCRFRRKLGELMISSGCKTHIWYVPIAFFLHIGTPWFAGRGWFLALSAAEYAGGSRVACTPRRKCGSRRASVARSLGVRCRAISQVIVGSLSAESSFARQWKPHDIKLLLLLLLLYHAICITSSLKLSSSLL